MSWVLKLYETYENCQPLIDTGIVENEAPLLPICHTTQKAQIEIVIDQSGNFKRAKVIQKEDSKTIIPCTETSGGRTGAKPEHHPLCDKLQYVAGDFIDFGGEVTSGFLRNPKEPYQNFMKSLESWCVSKYCHTKVAAVLEYTKKGNVIKDLVDNRVLFLGVDNYLLKAWDASENKDVPDIFKVLPGKKNANSGKTELWQADAFVRWVVEVPGEPESAVWKDASLFQSWIDYYASEKEIKSLCYVTGATIPEADQHPAKLRNDGDKAKLISSNDNSGFTFRGRFTNAKQACTIGFEVTQKAHNALGWLIRRQGYVKDDQAIVAWSTGGENIPDPLADTYKMFNFDDLESDSDSAVSTAQESALKLKKLIAGYSEKLSDTNNIVVMGMESATPGRMGISFYRELTNSDFLTRIETWHSTCCWIHNYRYIEGKDSAGKKEKRRCIFVGAPAPKDIAEAAYGLRVDKKLRKTTVERILPCIIDGQRLPRDLVESAVRRACNRVGLETWEWEKTLSIACALFRKYYEKEDLDMALDKNRKTRDYLYGRLLALAERLEQRALKKAGEDRQTSAARLMQRFADHPYTTWRTIELALVPYKARLGEKASYIQRLISEVIAMFDTEDFVNDKKLSGEFLLGYHCQRETLWHGGKGSDQD